MQTEDGKILLRNEMARVGQTLDADLVGYTEQLEHLATRSIPEVLNWLVIDRAIARHFQVAARKLVQHDTYRLIEEEGGVVATQKCPVADVAIRVDSMLSLMSDLKILERGESGYRSTSETRTWLRERLADLSSQK